MFSKKPFPLRWFADETPSGSAPAETPPAAPAPAPPAAPAPAADAPPSTEKVEDLPDWAQRIIRDARKEAGDHRTAAKTAGEQAQKDLSEKIAVALGLKPDAAQDPAALTASLQKEQAERLKAARELAVFKTAAATGADPSKLLDRASFLSSIDGIDPSDGAAIKTAVEAAIAADATLKATRAVAPSTVETPGGPGEQGQITEAQLAQMTPEQIAEAYEKGLLKGLLT